MNQEQSFNSPIDYHAPRFQNCLENQDVSSSLCISTFPSIDMRPFPFISFHPNQISILPFTCFRSPQDFPWFLLPLKKKSFHLIFPSFNVMSSTWSDRLDQFHSLWRMGKEPISPPSIWDTTHSLFERYIAFLFFIIQKQWQPVTIYLCTSTLSEPITNISFEIKNHLPFEPSPILLPSIETMNQDFDSSSGGWTVLDVGCGTGRDLAWIAHVYQHRMKLGIGIDKWKQAIDRALMLKNWMHLDSVEYMVMDLLRNDKNQNKKLKIKEKENNIKLLDTQLDSKICSPFQMYLPCSQFSFVLLNRMLPPRSFIPQLHGWIEVYGYICISTFIQLPDVPLHSPQHVKSILQPNELTRALDWKLLNQSEEKIWHHLDQFGWGFNSQNGYEIIKDEIVYIEDGRPVTWFLAKKVKSMKLK